jgi:hypothetical protein
MVFSLISLKVLRAPCYYIYCRILCFAAHNIHAKAMASSAVPAPQLPLTKHVVRECWLAAFWRAASGAAVNGDGVVAAALRDPRLVVCTGTDFAVRSVFAGAVTLFLGGSLRGDWTSTPCSTPDAFSNDDFLLEDVVAIDVSNRRVLFSKCEDDQNHYDNDYTLGLFEDSRCVGQFNGFGLLALKRGFTATWAADGEWFVAVPRYERFDGPPASVVVLSPELRFVTAFPVCCGKHPADISASATHVLVNMRSAVALFARRATATTMTQLRAGVNERFRCVCLVDGAAAQFAVIADTGVERFDGWFNDEWSGDRWDVHASEARVYDATGVVVRRVCADVVTHARAIACSAYHELVVVENKSSKRRSRVFVFGPCGALAKTYDCHMQLASVRLGDGVIVCLGHEHNDYEYPQDSHCITFR